MRFQCGARHCSIPVECPICKLTLVAAPQLSRYPVQNIQTLGRTIVRSPLRPTPYSLFSSDESAPKSENISFLAKINAFNVFSKD